MLLPASITETNDAFDNETSSAVDPPGADSAEQATPARTIEPNAGRINQDFTCRC